MLPTKPMGSPDAARRAFVLSGETRVHDIADACREAGVLFLAGSGGHWGRLELATWLTGPYASATRVDSRRALSPRRRPGVHHQRLTEASVESLLFRARERVIAMLEGASDAWATAAFARDMIDAGLVVGVQDAYGAIGYAPVDAREMRMFDRVASLFIADHLTRPHDYRGVRVCDVCGSVLFEWHAAHSAGCERRGPASELVVRPPRGRRPTDPGLG
jgi:hypothetical protein